MIGKQIGTVWVPILLVGVFLTAPFIADAQEGMITLNTDEIEDKQRPPVAFPHELHMGLYECLDCHHNFEGGENILDEDELYEGNEEIACSACHGPGDNPDLQQSFHYQCMGCHIQVRKSGQASGPELCGACHIPQ